VYGPVELSNLRPDKISVVPGNTQSTLVIKAVNPFPSTGGQKTYCESQLVFVFDAADDKSPNKCMARCDHWLWGGHASSDTLY
jgi:hypothetical protein